jgi:hypothetical protein
MWRHEDVFRTLGMGIDFVTGEWISDEYAPLGPVPRIRWATRSCWHR